MAFLRVTVPAAVLIALASGPASAELLKYEFVGATKAATVFIDTLTMPSNFFDRPPQGYFEYYGLQGTYLDNGVMKPATFTAAFFNPFQHGGLDLYTATYDPSTREWEPDLQFFSSTDIVSSDPEAALFTGSVSHPTLLKGSFVMQDWFSPDGGPLPTYSLTVAAVPEPATWMSMVFGIGALAWRQRRRVAPSIEATLADDSHRG